MKRYYSVQKERNILHTVNEEILQCPEGEEHTAYCK
jgi:hypothetical protein